MNTKHTAGQWFIDKGDKPEDFILRVEIREGNDSDFPNTTECYDICSFACDETENIEANAKLIAAAPELLQMVYDLKQAVKRLSQDDLTQFDRDTEAQIEGEAHELLTRINPDYYKNANT